MLFSIFITSLMTISGSLITLSSSTWMQAWLGLELNLLGFLPLMNNKNNPLSNEATMKYFLIQTISSSILILSISSTPSIYQPPHLFISITWCSLSLKLASAPLHFWLFPMIEALSWPLLSTLLTWQKIAPLSLIMNLSSPFVIFFSLMNGLIGSIMSLNQSSIKKLMGYSSISHMAWILALLLTNNSFLIWYFLLYTLSTLSSFYILMKNNISHFSQISTLPSMSKLSLFSNILSLMGFPPLLGFFPKILTVMLLIQNPSSIFLAFLLTLFSLISMFSYLQISLPPSSAPYPLKTNKKFNLISTIFPFSPFLFLPLI